MAAVDILVAAGGCGRFLFPPLVDIEWRGEIVVVRSVVISVLFSFL